MDLALIAICLLAALLCELCYRKAEADRKRTERTAGDYVTRSWRDRP